MTAREAHQAVFIVRLARDPAGRVTGRLFQAYSMLDIVDQHGGGGFPMTMGVATEAADRAPPGARGG